MDTYSLIEKAIIFINKSHRIHPSLEDMAAHVNMSPFHFNRVFKEWAGITPHSVLSIFNFGTCQRTFAKNSKYSPRII
ncbi:helix-turn-helix transcriptional regulator [Vermiphilus pyriformis]|nr:MAG: helix-turn-helix transcriptional regulator [Vermiphilus pyriformis]